MAKLYAPGEKITKKPTAIDQELSTWNPLRYAAKIPTYAYQAVRSSPMTRQMEQNQNVLEQLMGRPQTRSPLYVSSEKARQEAAQVLPESMTQKLSQDWLAQAALREVPGALAGGAFKSLPAAGKYGLQTLLGYGGSELGGAIGGEGGAVVGGLLGQSAPQLLPSRYFKGLPQPVSEDIKLARAKVDESAAMMNKAEQSLNKAKEKAGILKSESAQADILKEQRKLKAAKAEHSAAKKSLESQQKYDKSIEAKIIKQNKYYTASEPFENKNPADANKVLTKLHSLQSRLLEGLAAEDKATLMDALKDIENLAQENQLTTAQAKRTIRNLNGQIYADSVKRQNPFEKPTKKSDAVTNLIREIQNPLYEFIEKNNSPKHNQLYNKGREITKEIHNDIRGRKEYLKKQEKQQKIKALASEVEEAAYKTKATKEEAKLSAKAGEHKGVIEAHEQTVKEAKTQLKENQKILADLESIDKKKVGWLNKIGKNKGLSSAVTSALSGILSLLGVPYAGVAAVGGLGVAGGMGIYNEAKILANAARNHPKEFKEFKKLISDVTPKNLVQTVGRLNHLAKDLDIPNRKENKKRKGLYMPS